MIKKFLQTSELITSSTLLDPRPKKYEKHIEKKIMQVTNGNKRLQNFQQ